MNLGIVKKPPKVVLDTNVLISALVYGGKPEQVYNLVLEKQIIAVTSKILVAELFENLMKKFNFKHERIGQLDRIIKKHFTNTYPKVTIDIVGDEGDNRVLEAAVEGNCEVIITGDKELLRLGEFKNIKIVTAQQFLENLKN